MAERRRRTDPTQPLPYYTWYVKDWRANRKVWKRLDHVSRGLYRELLDECWLAGTIPDDVPRLAEIAECPVGVMAEAWPALKEFFTPVLDGAYYQHDRIENLRTADDKMRASRRLAALVQANARKCSHVPPSSSISSSNSRADGAAGDPDGPPRHGCDCGASPFQVSQGIHAPACPATLGAA